LLIGNYSTVEDEIIVDQADSPEIVDDFELGQDEVVDIKDKDVNKLKLSRRVAQYKVPDYVILNQIMCMQLPNPSCCLIECNLCYFVLLSDKASKSMPGREETSGIGH
jgi:hypothetical protein